MPPKRPENPVLPRAISALMQPPPQMARPIPVSSRTAFPVRAPARQARLSGWPAVRSPASLLAEQMIAGLARAAREALARDARAAALERGLERASAGAEEGAGTFPASPRRIYLADLRQGRTASWYAAEAQALAADLPAVAARHNRELLERELERRRAEIAARVCAACEPLLLRLPLPERARVMAALGIRPGANGAGPPGEEPDPVPAAKYRVFAAPLRTGDGREPDPEIAEVFAEEQEAFESNGDGRRGGRRRAEALVRGMLAPGARAVRAFGSSGDGPGPESIRGRRPRIGGIPLAVTRSMRADDGGAWIVEEDWATPLIDIGWEEG